MRHTLVLIFIIVVTQTVFSQDLIVTQEDVQLNCKISKLSSKEIFFIFIQDGVVKDSSLSRQFVKEYKFDRFAVNDTLEERVHIPPKGYSKYRVALNVGSGYLMTLFQNNKLSELNTYYNELALGSQISGDLSYYVSMTI